MGALNATIKKDATAMAPTGGTDATYTATGKQIQSGAETQDTAVTDFTVRPTMVMKHRPPTMGADGYYSKRKVSIDLVFPKKRADGSTVFSVWRLSNEAAVELTAAEFADQKYRASQAIGDTDFNSFWSDGVIAV